MEWSLTILLSLILVALWNIGGELGAIARTPRSISPQFPDLSGIEERLNNIFKIMGGEAKMKEETEKKRKDLKIRLIKLQMTVNKKTQKEAQVEANRLFEEAEFEETHQDWSMKFDNIEGWVKVMEIEERNKKKYGHLLLEARAYLREKTIIPLGEMMLAEALKIDDDGQEWLIEKLKQEKRLEEVEEYRAEDEKYVLKHYKVLSG